MSGPIQLSYDGLAVARAEQGALALRADSARATASGLSVGAGSLGKLVQAAQIVAEAEAHREAALADLGALHDLLDQMSVALGVAAEDLGHADVESAGRLSDLGSRAVR